MKKLIATEVVFNRVEILTDARGKTQFVLARRRDDLGKHDNTHWELYMGNKVIAVSPYRADLEFNLQDLGYRIVPA